MASAEYALLRRQLQALMEGVREPIPNLANCSALLYHGLEGLNWAGFYLNTGKELLLGPFQGKPACVRIPFHRGVCGAAMREGKTQRVEDVNAFPGHISCDDRSQSELAIPLRAGTRLVGILDLDSPRKGRFSQEDQRELELLAETLAQGCCWEE